MLLKFMVFVLLTITTNVGEAVEELGLSRQSFTKIDLSSERFFVGHSLTQTSYTLKKGESMAGTLALAYGVTDHLTLGTSPYLLALYNMPNFILRSSASLTESTGLGFQLGYMKTQQYLKSRYQMENTYTNFIVTHRWGRLSTSHFQINAMYFLNDARPFSIRVAKPTRPLQLSLSSIHELSFYKKYQDEMGVALEAGFIGVNEAVPFYHLGVSVYKKFKKLVVQGGISLSATPSVRLSDLKYLTQGSLPSPRGVYKLAVTHPEIQIQYYF